MITILLLIQLNRYYIYIIILFFSINVLFICCNSGIGKKNEYYQNGKLKSECDLLNGKLNGHYQEYYPTGKIKITCNYKNGLQDGLYREYYETGRLKYLIHYSEGKYNGLWIKYGKNTPMKIISHYKCGNQISNIAYYDTLTGQIMGIYEHFHSKGFYQNGKLRVLSFHAVSNNIKIIAFDEKGLIKKYNGPLFFLSKEDSLDLNKSYPNWQEKIKEYKLKYNK